MLEETQEAAPEASTEAAPEATVAPEAEAQVETTTESPQYDFILDKYRADGRTEAESLELQAKSYGELQTKFGAFTGAPDEYELHIEDGLKELGVDIEADDPLVTEAFETFKELNMSQEGATQLINLYAKMGLAEQNNLEESKAQEMKQLGNKAGDRISGINSWVDSNLDSKTAEQLRSIVNTADGVEAIEQLISKTRAAPIAPTNTTAAPAISESEVKSMQFAKDDNGNRRINTDPAFKAEYEKKRDALYGTQEYRRIVG